MSANPVCDDTRYDRLPPMTAWSARTLARLLREGGAALI